MNSTATVCKWMVHVKMCTWYTLSEMSFGRRYHQCANHTNTNIYLFDTRWGNHNDVSISFFPPSSEYFNHFNICQSTFKQGFYAFESCQCQSTIASTFGLNPQFIKITCFVSLSCIVSIWYRCRQLIFVLHKIVTLACASSALNWYQTGWEWISVVFTPLGSLVKS